MIACLICFDQSPRFTSSSVKYLFIIINSPASTLRTYIFDDTGSKHSVQDAIEAVEAVGIAHVTRLLRTPCSMMSLRKGSQSCISEVLSKVGLHISNCRMPDETGDPLNDL